MATTNSILYSQALNNYIKDVVMPSPNVASIAKYGEIPVSNSTGVPNITVPIYDLNYGNLSIPVSLSYHAGGLKVGEVASWVGLGWSLNAGYSVTRTVAGNPDDEWNGYINTRNTWTTSEITQEQVNQLLIDEPTVDPEPDIFNFSAGNYSGKFLIDRNGKVVLIPFQDVKVLVNHIEGAVSLTTNQRITGFTVIVPDGTKYIYGIKNDITQRGIERTTPRSSSGGRVLSSPTYYSSWFLIRVESHDSKYMIDLEYDTEVFTQKSSGSASIIREVADPSNNTVPNLINSTSLNGVVVSPQAYSYNTSDITTARLKQIKTPLNSVVFVPSNNSRNDLDYTDLSTAPKALSAIEVITGQFKHKYNFYQSYFQSSTQYTSSTSTRLKLDSIAQNDASQYIGSYKFNYIAGTIPDRLSKSVDHWGFYNGKDNSLSVSNIPPTTIQSGSLVLSMGDANRESDYNYSQVGVLNKIQYPTGGFTELEYEGNRAIIDPKWLGTPQQFTLYNFGSYRVEQLLPTTQQDIIFSQEQIETGYINIKVSGSASDIPRVFLEIKKKTMTGYEPFFSYIIKNTTGKDYTTQIYLKSIIKDNGIPLEPLANYQIKLTYQTIETPGYAQVQLYAFKPQQINLIEKEVGGIRVKKITSKASNLDAGTIKTFIYTLSNGQSSGVVSVYPDYGHCEVILKKSDFSAAAKVWHFRWNTTTDVPLADMTGKSIHYSQVSVIYSNNSKSVYTYNVAATFTPFKFPATPLNYDSNQDELLEERHYNDLGTELSYTIYKRKNNFVSTIDLFAYKVASIPGFVNFLYYHNYKITSSKYQLEEKTFMQDNVVQVTKNEYYDDVTWTVLPKKTITYNSDGKQEETIFKYIYEYKGSEVTSDGQTIMPVNLKNELLRRNILGMPVEVIKKNNNGIIGGQMMVQRFFDNNGIPTEFVGSNMIYPYKYYAYEFRGGVYSINNWKLKATINEYDMNAGKPKRAIANNWIIGETYTWDASKRLVSKNFGDLTWNINYWTNTNLVKEIIDENGLIKKFGYDGLQRLTMGYDRMKPDGTDIQANSHTAYQYSTPSGTDLNTYSKVRTATRYKDMPNTSKPMTEWQIVDGLGRLVGVFDSSNQRMKSYITYDNLGRQDRVYQPYLSAGGPTLPPAYVTPFKYNVYEASPLSRVLKSYNEDNTFVETQYGTNIANDVRIFTAGAGAGSATASGYYAANTLYKTAVINENGKTTELYKDKLGRVILTRKFSGTDKVETYNVYDDYGQLVAVLPPGSVSTTGAITHSLTFQYKFDVQNRLIEKKVPGAEPVKFFYDNRDLVTLTQDGNTKAISSTRYLGTQYDAMGRVLKTGWVTTSSPETFATSGFPIPDDANKLTETQYYPNKSWVKHQGYKLLDPANPNSTNFVWSYIERRVGLEYTGNPVWTGKQHLLNGLPNRPVLDADVYGVDWSVSAYNGLQKPYVTYRYMYGNASAGTQVRTFQGFAYDDAGRMTDMKYDYALNGAGVNASTTFTLTNMVYNHKDQLTEKNIGYKASSNTALQSIDYSYNLRGGLTSINSVNLNIQQSQSILTPNSIGTGTLQNLAITPWVYQSLNNVIVPFKQGMEEEMPPPPVSDNNADLFSENIYYNTADSKFQATPQYNGNIQAVAWQVAGRDAQGYGFTYDDLDRLTNAKYFDLPTNKTTGTTFSTDYKYNESQTYDMRGNILSLQRNGLNSGSWTSNGYTAATYGLIDNLTYTYNTQNQLLIVKDASLLAKGFKSVNNPNSTQYTYDANGNLKTDLNKGITNIDYNFLNLPQIITFTGGRSIQFIYDASGAKLRKIVNNNNVIETTDYVNGIEYKNNTLQRVAHPEGSITRQSDGSYIHEYVLRDHLGNTRVTFSDANNDGIVSATDIKQINNYYPFGLNMEGNWNGASGTNKYQYNEKEWNDDFGLGWNDYGARFYDPAVARWVAVDPLSEKYKSLSPYNYTNNNPIKFIDLDGRDFRLSVTRDKNGEITGVKISSTVYIQGHGANDKRANELNKFAKNNLVSKNVLGANVSFDVTYKYDESKTKSDLKDGENILKFDSENDDDQHISHVTGAVVSINKTFTNTMSGTVFPIIGKRHYTGREGVIHGSGKDSYTILHETLHLLGLSDRYTDHGTYMGKRTTTPDKGFEHDIMATNSLNISRAHYIIYLVTAHDVNNEKVFNRVIDRDSKGNKIP